MKKFIICFYSEGYRQINNRTYHTIIEAIEYATIEIKSPTTEYTIMEIKGTVKAKPLEIEFKNV